MNFQATTALVLWAVVGIAAAADVSVVGQASVIDGDTIEIRGQRIRLHGIDAPESRQQCSDGAGRAYRCGAAAAFALDERIAGRNVECNSSGSDRYGRMIGVCSVAGDDLGGWLAKNGHAVAYRKYSDDYIAAEAAAKSAGLGIWQGSFEMPWDWRRGR